MRLTPPSLSHGRRPLPFTLLGPAVLAAGPEQATATPGATPTPAPIRYPYRLTSSRHNSGTHGYSQTGDDS